MARLFPSKPVGTISPEMAKVVHALRRIPGEDTLVWISLPVASDWCPELMVLHKERACWLVTVSALTEPEAERAVQGGLFDAGPSARAEDLGVAERGLLGSFHAEILREAGFGDAADLPLRKVLAFPNVPQDLLDRIASAGGIEGFGFWGRDRVRSEALLGVFEEAAGTALPAHLVQCLRRKFSPESRIPSDMVSRARATRAGRSVAPELTEFLLDLDQEWLVKDDLQLSPEADAALREFRPRLVTGVAGSGKSLVLLYRAMLLAKLEPSARILVLTHNRPLNGELRDRFARLCPGATVEWATFFQWAHRLLGKWWREPLFDNEREPIIASLAGRFDGLNSLPARFLRDEIDWLRDQGIRSLDDYLVAVRAGRKRPLPGAQRERIFSLAQAYEAELRRLGKHDWPETAASLARGIESGHVVPDLYDFVFVDEAQFFAPSWFKAVRSAVRPQTGQLFLAADPTQGFLKRRQSWLASGLDVRGRSVRLRMSYRNTRETLEFAARFYRSRLPEDDEEINIPDDEEMAELERGDAPRFLRVDSGQTELARVANEIVAAVRGGADPGGFLVIHAQRRHVEPFVATLNRIAGRPLARDLNDMGRGRNQVKVSCLNAATGLECPVVFLCGLDALLEAEQALDLEASERDELVRDNTRRIYMGATRASAQLFIPYHSPATRECLEANADMAIA